MSSITLSYDQAAFNIAQTVKFNIDTHKTEGRLGAWKFSSSLYYVSSTEGKITKLWYDFLVLIGLVIDQKDSRFQNIQKYSVTEFNKLEQEFNKDTIAQRNAEKDQLNQQISTLNQTIEKHKQSFSSFDIEKTELLKVKDEGLAQSREIKAALDSAKTNHEDLTVKFKEAQQRADKSAADNIQLAKQIQELNKSLQAKEQANHDLNESLQTKAKSIQDFNAQINTLTLQIDALQKASKQAADASNKELEEKKQKVTQLEQENSKLKADYKKLKKAQLKEHEEKKKAAEQEAQKNEASSTAHKTEESKPDTISQHSDKGAASSTSTGTLDKPSEGDSSPRRHPVQHTFSFKHALQKLRKKDHAEEGKEDHKAEAKDDKHEVNKTEHKEDHKVETKEAAKEDHKVETKEATKEEHKAENKTEEKEDKKVQLKEEPKTKETHKTKHKRQGSTSETSTEAVSHDT